MVGDEEILPYIDQIDVVAEFVENATYIDCEKPVASLDDRKSGERISISEKYYKPGQLTLNLNELRVRLSKQRFRVGLGQTNLLYRAQDEDSKAERRILYIPDLKPSTMEVVLETAPRSHAVTLKNFFYNYLTGKAAIGVIIPPRGFKTFTFDLHIPYYVLRENKKLLIDSCREHGDKPLRKSLHLPFLSGRQGEIRSSDSEQCLYEAQLSVAVTGIDHRIWTAYGSFDTYFSSNDSVQSRMDRGDLAADQVTMYNYIWDPREYFFKVLESRMIGIRREWNAIALKVEGDVQQSRNHGTLPLNFENSDTRQEVRAFSEWSRKMVMLLRSLICRLGDTVDAWEGFQRKDIGYFQFDDDSPTSALFLKDLVNSVETIFSHLRYILRRFHQLENELRQDSPQGLHAHYNHGNHEAQLFQQKSARHIQMLTVITILYLPLALASNMFSTTPGVLPFTPNFGRFVLCLFFLCLLIVASIAALSKWDFFLKLICEHVPWWPRKATKLPDIEGGQGGIKGD
ncbi:hypothetical protein L207DRAFT_508317 [Hyaloscypha variabilis F]|uniref:Cora-domain-containing protein n=1 Tax=Hyaloscypha variabilis (strain UAMH 11265 / GT02V1 / F) TaxID=1149755 RepID=A0A2J6S3T5_HYAVF|nr:hypothetical protein L207DRAFT_508317 [Hyaloscypha variabilis F]